MATEVEAARIRIDYSEEDEYYHEWREMVINANSKKNFLLEKSAAVLFLWDLEHFQILSDS